MSLQRHTLEKNTIQTLSEAFIIEGSCRLEGEVTLDGAKNAVLVIMASLLLTSGSSILKRVPPSADVYAMIRILELLGAIVNFDVKGRVLSVDTTNLQNIDISLDLIRSLRASALLMGPLLARFGHVRTVMPGGDKIGTRPIDFHLKAFHNMGAHVVMRDESIDITIKQAHAIEQILEYPSVGATENIMMLAATIPGLTIIQNAAIEPEIYDLAHVLRLMGAHVMICASATICIIGSRELIPIEHTIMLDRLEAGTFLIAAAATGGTISIPQAPVSALQLVLEKLSEMGHGIEIDSQDVSALKNKVVSYEKDIVYKQMVSRVHLLSQENIDACAHITVRAIERPRAVSIRTMPYPGFPTDLQAPMMVAQLGALGKSIISEMVWDGRFNHVSELQKMGAQISVHNKYEALISGPQKLIGNAIQAHDIRAGAALIIAGLMAEGETIITGLDHIRRGYVNFDEKLQTLGAKITTVENINL